MVQTGHLKLLLITFTIISGCAVVILSEDADAAGSPVNIVSTPDTYITAGETYLYSLSATCETPTVADWIIPDWLEVDSTGWNLSGTAPDTLFEISYPVVVTVSSDTYQDIQRWSITVKPDSNDLQIVSTPSSSISSGGAYTYIPLTNIKGAIWSFDYLPSWLSYSNGMLYGVAPICEDDTDYVFSVRAQYGATAVKQDVTITVKAYVPGQKQELPSDDAVLERSQIDSKTFRFTFYDYSDLGVKAVVWDFGDGMGSVSMNPYHRYESPGTYLVTCTFYSNDGGSGSKQAYLTVVDNPSAWESLIDFLGFYKEWIVLGLAALALLYLFTKPSKVRVVTRYVKSGKRAGRRKRR